VKPVSAPDASFELVYEKPPFAIEQGKL